jgi:SAM-dependent methyltransferase
MSAILSPLLKYERRHAPVKAVNERPMEYSFALDALVRHRAIKVLDVGPGITAWPALLANCGYEVTAIDKIESYWTGAFFNRHFHVMQDDITASRFGDGEFDAITCLSVLEHIVDNQTAMIEMCRLLRPGGVLILTGPYNETKYIDDAYRMPDAGYGKDSPYICRVHSRQTVEAWLSDSPYEIADQTWWRVFTGPLWTQGERLHPPVESSREDSHHLSCITLVKR